MWLSGDVLLVSLLLTCSTLVESRRKKDLRDGIQSDQHDNELTSYKDHSSQRRRHRDLRQGFCELELQCKGGGYSVDGDDDEENLTALPVKLPIRGPRGPPGLAGEAGVPGKNGMEGLPGIPGISVMQAVNRIAFFVGLTENVGPVDEHTDILFDRVVTNLGHAYNPASGRFTAPINGTYQFNVIVSAQGRQKAAVMVLKNGAMVATVWAESIPYWATASNIAVLSMEKGDQVWLMLLNRASYLHGYMYTTFSGFMIFEN